MNAIAKTAAAGTAMALLQGLKKHIANVQSTLVKKGGEPYLRLLRDGSWVYGQDDTEVEAGSAWAINPLSIRHGWVAWKRGDKADNSSGPLQDIMVPCSQPMPSLDDLPKIDPASGASYEQQFSFSLKCLTGTDMGEQVLYKTASVGGVAEVDRLLTAIGVQLDTDAEKPVPVVTMEVDSYPHKKYGKTYTPVLAIKTWIAMSEDLPDLEDELQGDEPAKQEEPAKPTRTRSKASVPSTPAPEPTDEPEEEDEITRLTREIAEAKARKDAAAQTVAVDPVAAKRAALEAQLAELNGGAVATDPAPAGQPQRRRRA